MPNMSYCRFENTSADLKDCIEALSEMEGSLQNFYNGLSSKHEQRGFKRLMKLCHQIAGDYDLEEVEALVEGQPRNEED